jgi:peptidoglycan hydrolase-like protein with peptidoglycan-binding domain
MKLTLIASAITALLSTGAFAAAADPAAQQRQSADRPMSQTQGAQRAEQAGQPAARAEGAGAQGQAQAMSPEVVKKAQQALKDKGHDAGPVDGQYGPLTAQGVKKFQEAEKLRVTGRLDQQTLSALGVDAGSSAIGGSSARGEQKAGESRSGAGSSAPAASGKSAPNRSK